MPSCPLSFQPSSKDLPCARHPCDKTPIPGIKFPKLINSPYWNNIRYHEIRAQKRFPTAQRCRTFQPATQQCSVGQKDTSIEVIGIRLAFTKSQCECAKFLTPTYIRITDEAITKMEWVLDSQVLETLLPGENKILTIAEQKVLSQENVCVRVTFTTLSGSVTAIFRRVCFDPRAEYYHFFLEEIEASGCAEVLA
jgi:hypothetical protein